jgi:hypothetical protein
MLPLLCPHNADAGSRVNDVRPPFELTVMLAVFVQPPPTVAVTVYVPGPEIFIDEPVAPVLQIKLSKANAFVTSIVPV